MPGHLSKFLFFQQPGESPQTWLLPAPCDGLTEVKPEAVHTPEAPSAGRLASVTTIGPTAAKPPSNTLRRRSRTASAGSCRGETGIVPDPPTAFACCPSAIGRPINHRASRRETLHGSNEAGSRPRGVRARRNVLVHPPSALHHAYSDRLQILPYRP